MALTKGINELKASMDEAYPARKPQKWRRRGKSIKGQDSRTKARLATKGA